MRIAVECADMVPGLFEAAAAGDHAEVEAIKSRIFEREEDADRVKNKLRIVENVFQRAERHVDIAVVKVSDTERNNVDEKEIVNPEADHREWNVLDRVVSDVLKPMESKVGGKAQLLDRVMHLVKLPEKWNAMQQPMNIPLNEITDHEQRRELRPDR